MLSGLQHQDGPNVCRAIEHLFNDRVSSQESVFFFPISMENRLGFGKKGAVYAIITSMVFHALSLEQTTHVCGMLLPEAHASSRR